MRRWHQRRAPERERFDLQLSRTLTVTLAGVFILVLIWVRAVAPSPIPEPVVDLPRSPFAINAPEIECQQTISVRKDGSVFSFGEAVSRGRIAQLPDRRQSHICNSAPMRLRIDRTAPFGVVRGVLKSAQKAGWSAFTIIVQPLSSWARTEPDTFFADMSPDMSGTWHSIEFALLLVSGAAILAAVRRARGHSPGAIVWLLLGAATVAALTAWESYFPSCPHGWWC